LFGGWPGTPPISTLTFAGLWDSWMTIGTRATTARGHFGFGGHNDPIVFGKIAIKLLN